jgi:hypothetical protein
VSERVVVCVVVGFGGYAERGIRGGVVNAVVEGGYWMNFVYVHIEQDDGKDIIRTSVIVRHSVVPLRCYVLYPCHQGEG